MANRKLTAGIATLSWIDKKAQIPVDDPDPGVSTNRQHLIAGATFRFSNFLEAFIIVDDRGTVQNSGFTNEAGMYRGPSKFGINSAVVGKIGRATQQSPKSATFRQCVGARTVSHEVAGEVGGGGVGIVGGAVGGFMVGGPVGAFIGAASIGLVGYFTGKEVAELIMSFPPIWTEIELTINADGTIKYQLLSHSVFPSNTFYAIDRASEKDLLSEDFKRRSYHDRDQTNLKRWQDKGWGITPPSRGCPSEGNPWGMENPAKTIGVKMKSETPQGY